MNKNKNNFTAWNKCLFKKRYNGYNEKLVSSSHYLIEVARAFFLKGKTHKNKFFNNNINEYIAFFLFKQKILIKYVTEYVSHSDLVYFYLKLRWCILYFGLL